MLFIKAVFFAVKATALAFAVVTAAQAGNCSTMAEMAKDIANIRDAGVPLSFIEQRLRRDVKEHDELAMGILVDRIVYRTRATGAQLQKEVMKKC